MAQVAAVVSAVATVAGFREQRRAVGYQRAAAAEASAARTEQIRANELQARRSRIRALRESQILRARTMATAEGAGAVGSSAVAGGVSALGSQLGSALGYQTQLTGINRNISTFSQNAADLTASANIASGRAAMFAGISKATGYTPLQGIQELGNMVGITA